MLGLLRVGTDRVRGRLVGLALVAIVAVQAVVFAQSVPAAASSDYDEGAYLASVDALRHGQALGTDVFASQPPGWYRLLELLSFVTGRSVDGWRVAILVVALAGTLAAFALVRLLAGDWAGLTAAAALGLGPNYAEFAARIVADIPALTFTLGALGLAIAAFTGRRPGLAVAAGAVLTCAIAIKLTAVTVVPTILALVWIRRARLREIAGVAGGAAAMALVIVLPYVGALGSLWDGVVTVHREIGNLSTIPNTGANRYQLRQAYIHHGTTVFFWLELAGAFAFLLLLWRRQWSLWPLWLWTAFAAIAVEQTRPLQPNHYTLLSVAIALPVGASIGAVLARTRPGLLQLSLGFGVVVLLAIGYVRAGQRVADQPRDNGAAVDWAVKNLRSHSRPDQLVATDRPIVAYLADRRLPGELVDTSFLRFEVGSLTPSTVLSTIDRDNVTAVFSGREFRKHPDLVTGLNRRFPRKRQFEDVTLYLR